MLEALRYEDGPTALTGWVARPAGAARAAVLIFPTIFNRNDHIDRRAAMLAHAGCVAMIADLYGETPDDGAAAGVLGTALRQDWDGYRQRLRAALTAFRPVAGDLPVIVIGYCLGGQAALELARDGADIAAAVSFHGLLETRAPAHPGAVKARLLVCHGDADPMVPRGHVATFWDEMGAAGANWHFHSYSGVKHGFTDPASDARGLDAIGYDASADRQSWAATLELIDEIAA